jgi:hypothetical protein
MEKKKVKPVAIAPKIRSDAADFYAAHFPSLNAGATFVLESFPILYRATLAEIRGKFSIGELSMILDVLNGHGSLLAFGGSGLAGQYIVPNIEDSFRLDPGIYEEKWSINDPEGFVRRLSALTRVQGLCLEIWAAGFWEKYMDTTLDEYCRPLI